MTIPRFVRANGPQCIVIAALLTLSVAASAQFPGGGGGRGGTGGMHPDRESGGAGRERPPMGFAVDPVTQAAMDLSMLREDLKLVPAQEGAWNRYAESLRKFAEDIARNRTAMRFPKDPAPQQFELLVSSATNRLAAIEDLAEAGKALYATLTPDQREIADRRLARIATPLVTGDVAPGTAELGGGARGPRSRGESSGPR